MRCGEALALSYSDVDRKAGLIHVNKKLNYACGNNPHMDPFAKFKNGIRDVPLPAPLAAALPKNRAGLIFPGDDGSFMRGPRVPPELGGVLQGRGPEGRDAPLPPALPRHDVLRGGPCLPPGGPVGRRHAGGP